MKKTVHVEGHGKVDLTDRNYVASGGEAAVYKKSKMAYKIYHDRSKMIPVGKIRELQKIQLANVLVPQSIIRDMSNKAIGYTMPFISSSVAVCRLFTKAYRTQHRVSKQKVAMLVREIQSTLKKIHGSDCLVVDLNELNIMVGSGHKVPYFIDTDSYQTASHKATAIMPSVRDPLVKGNNFTEESDWFSFAIIAFQLYIGIHPYKGRHPDYRVADWLQRMADGISVFHKDVSLPKTCNDFSIIPQAHLDWFKLVFVDNERCEPPQPDAIGQVMATVTVKTITVDDKFSVNLELEYPEDVVRMYDFMGVRYAVTTDAVYQEKKQIASIKDDDQVMLCETTNMRPVLCRLKGEDLLFEDASGYWLGHLKARDCMYRDGCFYSVYGDKLTESRFLYTNGKVLHTARIAANISAFSTKVFDGVVMQDLCGTWYATVPYEAGYCAVKALKELCGFKVLEARSESNVLIVLGESKGKYTRFIFVFDSKFTSYTVRKQDGVGYGVVNFTVKPDGVAILAKDDEVEIFKDKKAKLVKDPPFDSSTRLFNILGSIHYIDGEKVFPVSLGP